MDRDRHHTHSYMTYGTSSDDANVGKMVAYAKTQGNEIEYLTLAQKRLMIDTKEV
jgi:hypothetical protein